MAKSPKKPTGEKQKPERAVVKQAAKDLRSKTATKVQKSTAARILDDQKNDPRPNKKDPSPTKPKGRGKK